MRAVIQRVEAASVRVGGEITGAIGRGFMVLLGVGAEDTPEDMAYLLEKLPNLRIFDDDAGKMNLSLLDVDGAVLAVSQFTLYADTRHGRRPGFSMAAAPDVAEAYYEDFVKGLRDRGVKVETGVFQAHMQVELVNDGPVTIIIDSKAK